jgi:hypothetical protein
MATTAAPHAPAGPRLVAAITAVTFLRLVGACSSKVEPGSVTATRSAGPGVQSIQSAPAEEVPPTRSTEDSVGKFSSLPCLVTEDWKGGGCQRLLKRGGGSVEVFDTWSLDAVPREPITVGGWDRPLDIRNEFPVPGKEATVNSYWLEEYRLYYRALAAGVYVFEVSADAPASMPALGRRLLIDGKTVLTFSGPGTKRVPVELPRGYREIQVQFVESADARGVIADRHLSIAVPGSQQPTVINPEEMLTLHGVACGVGPMTKFAECGPNE